MQYHTLLFLLLFGPVLISVLLSRIVLPLPTELPLDYFVIFIFKCLGSFPIFLNGIFWQGVDSFNTL
jgi:hypothetical protein